MEAKNVFKCLVQASDPSLPGSTGSRHVSHYLVSCQFTSASNLFRTSKILHKDSLVLVRRELLELSDVMVTHRDGEVVENGRHHHSLHRLAMMETEVCEDWKAPFPDAVDVFRHDSTSARQPDVEQPLCMSSRICERFDERRGEGIASVTRQEPTLPFQIVLGDALVPDLRIVRRSWIPEKITLSNVILNNTYVYSYIFPKSRDEDPTFISKDPARQKKNPDPTLNQNEEKNIFIFLVGTDASNSISADCGLYFFKMKQFYKSVVTGRIRIRGAKNQRIRPDPDPHPCQKVY